MRASIVCASLISLALLSGGCAILPSAVWPSGEVHVKMPAVKVGAKTAPAKFHAVVVKYWKHEFFSRMQVLNVFATDTPDISLTYPPAFYSVCFTIMMGFQHVAPRPSVAVFTDGYWPMFESFNYDRHCCEAPQCGYFIFNFKLIPLDQPPPAHYAPDYRSPFDGKTLEEVQAALKWYWLDESDRQIVLRGVRKCLEEGKNWPHTSR